ncbi:MAG: adenosylmethionine decarboxylase [Verrucomicrobiota bacterium]
MKGFIIEDSRSTLPAAIHLLADYSGCPAHQLTDKNQIDRLLLEAAESVRSTVVAQFSHLRPDGGLSSMVLIQESHLAIRTYPGAGYAIADFFTCGESDPHAAYPILREGLSAKDSKLITIDRGKQLKKHPKVRGYQKIIRETLDCRGSHINEGLKVARIAEGDVGLFATRDFKAGETVFECEFWLTSFDTIFKILTDVGEVNLSADDLGWELTLPEMERFPDVVCDIWKNHYRLDSPSIIELREHITGGRSREVMVSSFDGLARISENANIREDFDQIQMTFENNYPQWRVPMVATDPIMRGEEIFWESSESRYKTDNLEIKGLK